MDPRDVDHKDLTFATDGTRTTIDLFRGACAVDENVPVAGHAKRVDHGDAFDA